MKKLYRKGKVHPSPPAVADCLSLLPATILSLTVALTPEDKELLAYLIGTSADFSGHSKTGGGGGDHPPLFQCSCFKCYMSYWVRWDASPNRQLIHEILDAYEDGLFNQKKIGKVKKERRNRVRNAADRKRDSGESESVGGVSGIINGCDVLEIVNGDQDGGDQVGLEKGSVRKLVSFIGERIWGVWGM